MPKRTAEQLKASYEAHKGDFDYLLGESAFTSVSKEFGARATRCISGRGSA